MSIDKLQKSDSESVSTLPETLIGLDDIRVQLETIEDKILAQSILSHLSQLQNALDSKQAAIAMIEANRNTLQAANSLLLARVAVNNENPLNPNTVDFNGIDPLQDIIDGI